MAKPMLPSDFYEVLRLFLACAAMRALAAAWERSQGACLPIALPQPNQARRSRRTATAPALVAETRDVGDLAGPMDRVGVEFCCLRLRAGDAVQKVSKALA